MERERKGRARPEHGVRPLLKTLGLVRIAKTGEAKIAWREIAPKNTAMSSLTESMHATQDPRASGRTARWLRRPFLPTTALMRASG